MTTLDLDIEPIGDLDFLKHVAEVSNLSLATNLVANAPPAVEKELKKIRKALSEKNPDDLRDACHSLKGACYSVRVVRLAKMAAQMEDISSDIARAEKLLQPLEIISIETIAWWHEILEKNLIAD